MGTLVHQERRQPLTWADRLKTFSYGAGGAAVVATALWFWLPRIIPEAIISRISDAIRVQQIVNDGTHEHLQSEIDVLAAKTALSDRVHDDGMSWLKEATAELRHQIDGVKESTDKLATGQGDVLKAIKELAVLEARLEGRLDTVDSERKTLQDEVKRLRDRGAPSPKHEDGGR